MYIKQSNKTGFTLVETLIAIAVLMIAIAGPLTIANRALTAALYAKDQSIASYLAQEEMEYVKNLKDNYIKKTGGGWDTFVGSFGIVTGCIKTNPCGTDTYSMFTPSNPLSQCGSDTGCPLYIDSVYGYKLTGSDKSLFSRYFYIDQIGGDANDYQVTVVVKWNEGLVPNIVQLSSELTNSTR